MRKGWTITAVALFVLLTSTTPPPGLASVAIAAEPGPPTGSGSYGELVSLFDEFLKWKNLTPQTGEFNNADAQTDADDYRPQTIAARRATMNGFIARVMDMNVASWPRQQQVDYLAVRSQLDQQNFILNVSKPWERDPGFYVDQMMAVTFADLPVKDTKLAAVLHELRAMPVRMVAAKATLRNIPGDFADLALHNLVAADGVGHGHPYRTVPPAGVIGWYDDFLARARKAQPALVAEIVKARAAAIDFQGWLKAGRPAMTASAGVGEANFNWYLKQVKLLPYTADQLLVLGARETDRLWSIHALEEHRNRKLPVIALPTTEAEYLARRDETDRRIRDFLIREDIISVPADIGPLYVNVPWIVRPTGPNFWEQVQYRDPSPDYLHATIPGHAFDGAMGKRVKDPIRGRINDGVRIEGWGVYLEEAAQKLGFFEDKPRVRELIDIFGIFRAVRVAGDIKLQLNQVKVNDVVAEWQRWTPWLDPNVARVDAEIYLRRPPGYGLGYTIGMIEMQKLLADRRHQLGDKFVLREYHDAIMTNGRLPPSLLRWDITGYDDEIRQFWSREPIPGS